MATDNGRQKRTPFSLRLPQASLDQAIPVAAALYDYGAPATPHVIAQKMGTTYSSSWFKTRIAAAGYYGLIRMEGDKRVLTERGEAICGGDADGARQARREAVMATSFGPLIHDLRSRPVNESNIALRLQHENGVPEGSAPSVAKALIEAATQAELIEADVFDAGAIESASAALPTTSTTAQPRTPKPQAEAEPPRKTETVRTPTDRSSTGKSRTKAEEAAARDPSVVRPLPPSVQVVININAESLSPTEIAELVQALQSNAKPPRD